MQQGQARNSPQPAAPPAISIDALDSDIQALIDSLKAEFALRPFDGAIQTKLKALLDLQTIVRSSNLPQEQLVQVKNQVAELSVNIKATGSATPVPGSQPPVASVGTPVQGAPPAAAPAGTPQLSLDSILGPGALAALMARNAAAAATSVPQAAVPAPPPPPTIIRSPPPSQYTTAPPPPPPAQPSAPANSLASNPQALLEMLRKAGLITPTPPTSGAGPAAGGPPPPPAAVRSPPPLPIANPIPIPPALPQGIASLLSPSTQPGGSGGSVRQPIETLFNDIQLQTWSLKQ